MKGKQSSRTVVQRVPAGRLSRFSIEVLGAELDNHRIKLVSVATCRFCASQFREISLMQLAELIQKHECDSMKVLTARK